MFVKLIDNRTIEKAPRCIHVGATTYVMPNAEQYAEADYFELVQQEQPEARKWYDVVATYEKQDNKIYQGWEYIKQDKPDYATLIVGYIREQYSLDDELALQRQRDNSEEKKEEFDTYNAYCDNCKLQAKADIAEWEEA